MKKYKDDERPRGVCYDCKKSYDGPDWVDVVVDNDLWEKINPTYHKGAGLLCANCTTIRIQEATGCSHLVLTVPKE